MSQTTDPRRRALGRGLEALLPPRPPTPPPTPEPQASQAPPPTQATGKPLEIPLDQIERNPLQTRTSFDETLLSELASSIAATGVVQPIVVRPLPDGRFQLITGERRWMASRRVGKNTIPAIVREVSDEQAMEMTIVENLQRADLNPMEQARAFHRLSTDFHMSQEQMATRTGKQRASVANFLRLLRLPEAVQQKVESGELSFGHARTLLALESAEAIQSASQRVLALNLSVRQTEAYVQGQLNPESRPAASKPKRGDPNVREAQDQLQHSLGLRVRIEDRKGRGRVIIEYSGLEDFDAILRALGRASSSAEE